MPSRYNRVLRWLPLATIVLLGLGMRVWGLTWGLWNADVERRPHPDEWVVYWLFRWFGHHHNLNPCPDAVHGQCFFDWGSVYPYLAYAVHGITLPVARLVYLGPHADPAFTQAVLGGRITSVLTSLLTILAVYRLGRLAYDHWAGIVAALLVSLSGLLIELAHFASPDSTTVLLCTLTLLAALRYVRRPSQGRLIVAAVFAGLAAGSEYHMVLLGIPLLAAWFLGPVRRAVWLLVAALAAALVYVASNPYMLVEFNGFQAAMLHTLRIRTVDSKLEYGDRFNDYGPGWLYPIHYVLGYGMDVLATIWMLLGFAWSLVRRRQEDLILLAWIIPYALLISISSAKFLRYGAPLLPAGAVLAGGFAVAAWRQVNPSRHWLLAAAAASVVLYSFVYDAAYAGLFASPDPRLVATRWLENHASPGALVGFSALPDGVVNLPYYVSAAGYHPCFSLYKRSRLNGPMQYLMVDSYSVEEHSGYSDTRVQQFGRALDTASNYRAVARIWYTPTFLGLSFPIAGSPHDWRYAAHQITIYRHIATPGGTASYCFPNVSSAVAALYVPSVGG